MSNSCDVLLSPHEDGEEQTSVRRECTVSNKKLNYFHLTNVSNTSISKVENKRLLQKVGSDSSSLSEPLKAVCLKAFAPSRDASTSGRC